MSAGFSSNILFKQPLSSREDIFVSFLIQNPVAEVSFGDLVLQSGDKLLLQDSTFLSLNYSLIYDGFGIFLLDSNVFALTGGGSGAGLGLITDTIHTSISAISGFFLCAMFDVNGMFGAYRSLDQFTTGSNTPQLSSISVRKLSSFKFVGSQSIHGLDRPFGDEWNVFRVAFKNNMQQVVYYEYKNGVYSPLVTFDTNIPFTSIPQNVRVGLTWSGNFPISVKNININATVDS